MVLADTRPRKRSSLIFETERTFSHWMKLSDTKPPSGGLACTCQRTLLCVRVSGMTTTRSAGPSLKISTDTTRAGRTPACSCPSVGSRLRSHTSPREGSALLTSLPVHQLAYVPRSLSLWVLPSTPLDHSSKPRSPH